MRIAVLIAALAMSACVMGGAKEGGKGTAPKANPITGEAIQTTSLDRPAAAVTPAAAPNPAVAPKASALQPAPALEGVVKPADAAVAEPSVIPAAPASAEEIRCVKAGGLWAGTGKSGAKACVRPTRDAGKACTRQTQCEGYCLARSRSCAPVTPLFGCNDILQPDGREVTLCID